MANYEQVKMSYKFDGTVMVNFSPDEATKVDISYTDGAELATPGLRLCIAIEGELNSAISRAMRDRLLPQLPHLLEQAASVSEAPPAAEPVVEKAAPSKPKKKAKKEKQPVVEVVSEPVEKAGCDHANEMRENSGAVPPKEASSEGNDAAIKYFTNPKKPVKQLKEVVSYFLDNGCTSVDEVTAAIMAIKEDVPLLRKAQRVDERVKNIFVVLGLDV